MLGRGMTAGEERRRAAIMERHGLLPTLLCMVPVLCALTAVDASAYMPQEPAPGSIGEESAYRWEGSLVNLTTCLAVADDEMTTRLLRDEGLQPVLGMGPVHRADILRSKNSEMKNRRGFGTLLACAEIVSAWHSRTLTTSRLGALLAADPARPQHDGRIEHGAVVIDLAIDTDQLADDPDNRLVIGAQPLARLLTSPGMLPQSVFGGIVVKNAIIERPLILNNVRVTSPIAFVNVQFSGGTLSQEVFDIHQRTEETAVLIASAQLDHDVLFADSQLCGNVIIRKAHFEESLTLRDVEQRNIGCAHPASAFGLRVDDSRFDQGLSIARSRFAATTITGSSVKMLAADRVDFGRSLVIEENKLGGIELECSTFADRTDILRNRVEQTTLLEGIDDKPTEDGPDRSCRTWWETNARESPHRHGDIQVANNHLEGGFFFQHMDGIQINSPIKLPSNRVGGRSLIMMPRPVPDARVWDGDITLERSNYDGLLELHGSPWPTKRFPQDRADRRYCTEISNNNPLYGTSIELRASHIRTLLWNLPFTCEHRWLGYGLTYDLWWKGDRARKSLESVESDNQTELDHRAMGAWRRVLKRYDSPSIHAMSTYLTEKGEFVVSREILLEAKRLNYVPNCSPDQWMPGCALRTAWELLKSLAPFDAPPADENLTSSASIVGIDAQVSDRLWTIGEWLWRLAMLILLWPGGYGAQPERAFLLLLGFFALCWILYALYTCAMRNKLLNEWGRIDRFLVENAGRIGRTNRLTARPPGYADAQRAFRFDHPLPSGDSLDPWIAEATWKRRMSHEERLREVQGPLLAKVRAWERSAAEEDVGIFEDFRRDLERFGNTEIVGFGRFDGNKMPRRFSERLYSLDTMLPVVDLHAYNTYYPIAGKVRLLSIVQHVCGWWWITVFIASAAIL
ncbi:MAG: hypothetical protein HC871_08465 [Rhizobiales bacterium]|nr:hypothetical protein [Hyphomicrobiales bacterium]